ncbi:Glycoside hydrolase family 31 [Carpediemonas membranifera]|uniref:alpha-glucosidase n=1 Tax=Carpediemonas membranifera TaxID=201153 RepID=A0A8J6AZU5_9EUKA|nr:Glycoside hydrolase family 31 [Carpediemonas membranifera]|eukprot:KAG9389879.1 Glycoside hydrolase family 31 [Carpediemonas membranifera]
MRYFSLALLLCFALASYRISDSSSTYGEKQAVLTYANDAPVSYCENSANLALSVKSYKVNGNDMIRVTLTDKDNARWQVPEDAVIPNLASMKQNNFDDVNVDFTASPASLKITRKSDGVVLFDTAPLSTDSALVYQDCYLSLANTAVPPKASIYGIGEQMTSFHLADPMKVSLFSSDNPTTPAGSGSYGTHPFYVEIKDSPMGHAYGMWFMNSNAMEVTFDRSVGIKYETIGGVLDFFIFTAVNPIEVVKQYHALIGYPVEVPYWAFGWQQSRWGWPNLDFIENVVAQYDSHDLPLDVVWFDIDYMDKYRDFTFDPVRFPHDQVKAFTNKLHRDDRYLMAIVDPSIANVTGYAPHDDGMAAGVFVKDTDNTPFLSKQWAGFTYFPDYLANPATTAWWTKYITSWVNEYGIDGVWTDMNEPACFMDGISHAAPPATPFDMNNPPWQPPSLLHPKLYSKTLPMTCHDDWSYQYNTHSLYGFKESVDTRTAIKHAKPGLRSFLLTRSSFAGSGRYTSMWLGDNEATWAQMSASIAGIMTMNMMGLPMVGADACGFIGDTTQELCTRWSQLSAFTPFSRNHNANSAKDQEPYLFDQTLQNALREAVYFKYQLFPFYYTQYMKVTTEGGPFIRGLAFEFPDDYTARLVDTTFMVGSSLLVAPMLGQGSSSLSVYLPDGVWKSLTTADRLIDSKGAISRFAVPLGDPFPVFVRGGHIVPMQESGRTLTAAMKTELSLYVVADRNGNAEGEIIIDDGLTEHADRAVVQFKLADKTLKSTVVESNIPASMNRSIWAITVVNAGNPKKVKVNGKEAAYTTVLDGIKIHNIDVPVLSEMTVELM